MSDFSDQDIFEQATAPDSQPPASEPEQHVDSQASDGRPRDDRGRFAPKEQPQQAEQAAPEPVTPPPPEAKAEPEAARPIHVPLSELLSTRERAQRAEAEREQLRQQMEALQRNWQEQERARQAEQKRPDFFENPDQYIGSIQQSFDQRMREMEANMSLRLAKMQHGEKFDAAYSDLQKAGMAGDRMAVQRVLASPDPGDALMRWHREKTLFDATGGDLDGFLKKREEELLENPEFMKRVAEKLRAQQSQAPSAPGGRPPSVVSLPPSLSRVPGSGGSPEMDTTDAGLFAHATSRLGR